MDKRTLNSILTSLQKMVESKVSISPEQWVDAALYLQILKFDEQELRLKLEIAARNKHKEILSKQEKTNASAAEIEWRATPEYENWQRQEKKMEDVEMFVQIAKKEADIRKI